MSREMRIFAGQWLIPVSLMLTILGCATVTYTESEFNTTRATMRDVRSKCEEHMKNELTAQKECFPLLNDKELLVRVNEVKVGYGGSITLESKAGSDNVYLFCELTEKESARLAANPADVVVGRNYFVKGSFRRISLGTTLDFYYLDNCTYRKYESVTK